MNDKQDEKLLNAYEETETCVDDNIDNASLSGSTEAYLFGAPTGWYQAKTPDSWKPWPWKSKTKEPKFDSIDSLGNWSEFTFCAAFTDKHCTDTYIAHKTPSVVMVLPLEWLETAYSKSSLLASWFIKRTIIS